MVRHELKVSRFVGIGDFTERQADNILAKMGHVLQTDDSVEDLVDYPCEVNFVRAGPVDVFLEGDGTILDEEDFNRIIALPGNVKVVEIVDWCARRNVDYVACARVGGDSFVVEAGQSTALAGVIWAHEYGHNKGLRHRRGEPGMVMNRTFTQESRRVEDWECERYRAAP